MATHLPGRRGNGMPDTGQAGGRPVCAGGQAKRPLGNCLADVSFRSIADVAGPGQVTTMGYVLLAISIIATIAAASFWAAVAGRRSRNIDLADMSGTDWPSLVGVILPRSAREVYNLSIMALGFLLMGALHLFYIYYCITSDTLGLSDYLMYVCSLALWLVFLGFPAMLMQQGRAAPRKGQEPPE